MPIVDVRLQDAMDSSEASDKRQYIKRLGSCFHQSASCRGGTSGPLLVQEPFPDAGGCVAVKAFYRVQLCDSCISGCRLIDANACIPVSGLVATQGCLR